MTAIDSGSRWRLVACGALASLLVVAIYLHPPGLIAYLDQRVYDVLFRSAHHSHTTGRVVIVDLDDRSLEQLGRWPWPRSLLAELLTRIRGLGAASIGLDMVLPEPDETPPSIAPQSPAPDPSSRGLSVNDAALAAVLRDGSFVLGYSLDFGARDVKRTECVVHPLRVVTVQRDAAGELPLFQASPGICSLSALAGAANASGFLNAAPDRDGILRRMPLLIAHGDAVFPSLGLATLLPVLRPRRITVQADAGGAESLTLDDMVVPLDSRGGLLLHFRGGQGAFRHISAVDVLDDRVPPGTLRDRVVFLGSTAVGLRDTVTTPLDTAFPGVELHATVADTILRRDFVQRPRVAPLVEIGLTVAAGPIAALAVATAGVAWAAPLLGAVGVALWLGAGWLIGAKGIFISPLFPTAALAVAFTALVVVSFVIERGRADRTTGQLRQARDLFLHSLTSLTGTRDHDTGAHLLRTQRYMQTLCERLAGHPRFRDFLTPDTIDNLARLAPIHDIGKVGVSDLILRKPGPLTAEEWEEMRRHPSFGYQVIAEAEHRAGIRDDALLRLAKDVVQAHHERWDGTGYPDGLAGDDIPVAGRLVAVIDVYDALVSKRVYKDRIPHDEVVRMIVAERGTHFDPDVVDALVRVQDEWRRILSTLGDEGTDPMHP